MNKINSIADIQTIYNDKSNLPNYHKFTSYLKLQKRLDKKLVLKLLNDCISIIKQQPNLISIIDPVTIVGDIHGQFYDLLRMFEISGDPRTNKYLFLGDYIDRGVFSMETLLLLISIKINYPSTFFLLRGNHESRQMTSHFNFRTQCLAKFDQQVYQLIMDLCDSMPLACIINKKFIALHGGLSPLMGNLVKFWLKQSEDILKINRFKQPPKSGIFCDILWSDPVPEDKQIQQFGHNTLRGCSFFFGPNLIKKILDKNKLTCVIRGHEVQHKGYKLHKYNKSNIPSAITIFSAPNYCDIYGNQAAVMKINNNISKFLQYHFTPHPYVLPNFLNLFEWSIPFLADKVNQLFITLTQKQNNKNDDIDDILFDPMSEIMVLKNILNIVKTQNQIKLNDEKKRIMQLTKILDYDKFTKVKQNDKQEYSSLELFGPKINFTKLSFRPSYEEEQHQNFS